MYSQDYDLNTGVAISQDKMMNAGYFIGGNFIIKTNQNRRYLNNLILGFENSGFQSNTIKYSATSNIADKKIIQETCNCTLEDLGNINYKNIDYKVKYQVIAVSINLGVELEKRWYFMSGITSYNHITILNGNKTSSYREMFIDVGLKYFIKSQNWYFIPTVKYNPYVISFGLGISYK